MAAARLANMETTHVRAMYPNISNDDAIASRLNPRARALSQPIEAALHDDALLKMRTVTALTGRSASSIYRLVAAGELKAIKRGTRCTRFRAGDITAWLRAQGQAA